MPGVDVLYRTGAMSTEVADAIKETVRHYGASVFSTPEIELCESDFSFKFYRPEKYDDLVKDVIVRIRLHHFSKRLEDTDGDAAGIALLIGSALSKVEDFDPTRTVGLEILVGEIGWGSATVMQGKIVDGLAERAIAGSVRRPGRAQMSADE